ncbi:MAG: DUF721 domain-containing protein [Planctomycetota bacterium]
MKRGPQPMSDLLAELMAGKGFARVQSTASYEEAWRAVAGEMLVRYTRVGALKRGCLEIIVANSLLLQELTFQKQTLLEGLAERLPGQGIRGLRFRVGSIS